MLVENPTELTTAATDIILTLVALGLAVLMARFGRKGLYSRLWQALFISLAIGSFLGAVAHGMEMATNNFFWPPIYFFLGLTLTLLGVAAIHDGWGYGPARRLLFWVLPAPLLVVVATSIGSGSFLVFILFEVIVMVAILIIYLRLSVNRRAGAGLILAGVVFSIAAAVAQSVGPYTFRLIWLIDHNGLFHLVQIPGLLCFYAGASRSQVSGGIHDNQ